MEEIKQRNAVKSNLDLREWREMVKSADEAQSRILGWETWPFYRYDESKEWILTLKDKQLVPYKVSDTEVHLPFRFKWEKFSKRSLQSKILNALKKYELLVDYDNRVKDSDEAYRRAEEWEKEMFWFISEDKSTIRTLDFSEWEKPLMMDYPVKDTKLVFNTMEL